MFRSNDGLCKSASIEFVNTWNEVAQKQIDDTATWISELRKNGVKAAHPDDGWVDREKNTVRMTYPQFNDGIKVGDVIALGWADRFRLVRVTGKTQSHLGNDNRYSFEPM